MEVQEEVHVVVPEAQPEGDWELLRGRLQEERRVEVLAARHDSRQRLCNLLADKGWPPGPCLPTAREAAPVSAGRHGHSATHSTSHLHPISGKSLQTSLLDCGEQ